MRLTAATAVLGWTLSALLTSGAQSHDDRRDALEVEPFFVALSVRDVEKSSQWYERTFGYSTVRKVDLEARGVRIRLLKGPGGVLELVQDRNAKALSDLQPRLAKRYLLHGVFKTGFKVKSLAATQARLKRLGVPLRGKVVTESDGSMRSLQVEDPDGNVIQIFEVIRKK